LGGGRNLKLFQALCELVELSPSHIKLLNTSMAGLKYQNNEAQFEACFFIKQRNFLVVNAIQIITRLTGFLIASVDEYAVAIIWSVVSFGNATRECLCPFDIGIRTSVNLISLEKCYKADQLIVPTRILVIVLRVIVETSQITASLAGFPIAAVNEYPIAIIWPIVTLGDAAG